MKISYNQVMKDIYKKEKKPFNIFLIISKIFLYVPMAVLLEKYCIENKVSPAVLLKTNPAFSFSGLICAKTEIFKKFLKKRKNARFFAVMEKIEAKNPTKLRLKKLLKFIKHKRLKYPLIIKPDKGFAGVGLALVKNENHLIRAVSSMEEDYVLQEYSNYPYQMAVFFIRNPGEKRGRIWSLTRISFLNDGDKSPKLIVPSTKRLYSDESRRITPALERIFNDISGIGGFYFGRFDIKVKNINAFIKTGKGFKILEVNVGPNAIALHAFDKKYSIIKQYSILNDQLVYAFNIARKNARHLSHSRLDREFKDFWTKYKEFLKQTLRKGG